MPAQGLETIAQAYLRSARSCYLRWGAEGKVRQLDRLHPQLRQEAVAPRAESPGATRLEQLDLGTVVKVSQAVSGEIDLRKLIDTLMATALRHAGADRGLLILPAGDELRIEAEATTIGDHVEVRLQRSGRRLHDACLNRFSATSSGPGRACCWTTPRSTIPSRATTTSAAAIAGRSSACR